MKIGLIQFKEFFVIGLYKGFEKNRVWVCGLFIGRYGIGIIKTI